jgi:hypothetical protein
MTSRPAMMYIVIEYAPALATPWSIWYSRIY